jgi:hypothetical protein
VTGLRSFSPVPLCTLAILSIPFVIVGVHIDNDVPLFGKILSTFPIIIYRFWIVNEWSQVALDTIRNKTRIQLHLLGRVLTLAASTLALCPELRLDRLIVCIQFLEAIIAADFDFIDSFEYPQPLRHIGRRHSFV